ncbi:MAG: DUF1919 domain-containing protein [Thermoguttaceae bacterium]|nr:DUF1919 domain-containing protein [Thermoguttaceae bacterium]
MNIKTIFLSQCFGLKNFLRQQSRPMHRFLREKKNLLVASLRRLGLRTRDFSIISNNCSGGYIYQYFGLLYKTPTVGLYFSNKDYLKLIQNPRYYFSQELQFIALAESQGKTILQRRNIVFPVAKLGDIEVYFMHYKTEEEAREKWTRRVQRINYDRLVFLFTESKHMDPEHIETFEHIGHPNKIFLTIHDYPDCSSAVKVVDTFSGENQIIWPFFPVVSALPWKQVLNRMMKKV